MARHSEQKLHLSDELVTAMLYQIAPQVTQLTGWDLGLDTLKCRVVPKDQGYEAILLTRLEGMGIHGWLDMVPDLFERMLEFLIEQNTLAAYLPEKSEILVIRENVDDSNMDGLRLLLAHELVHRGQHIVHGHLFSRLEELLHQAYVQIQSSDMDFRQTMQIMDEIQPIMTLLESHAAYVQGILQRTCFPNAHIESQFNLATLLMRLIGARKIAQYSDELPQINAAVASVKVNSLYTSFED
jgi:hypothetical protein